MESGYLSEENRKTILALLGKSMVRVFYKDEALSQKDEEIAKLKKQVQLLKYSQ